MTCFSSSNIQYFNYSHDINIWTWRQFYKLLIKLNSINNKTFWSTSCLAKLAIKKNINLIWIFFLHLFDKVESFFQIEAIFCYIFNICFLRQVRRISQERKVLFHLINVYEDVVANVAFIREIKWVAVINARRKAFRQIFARKWNISLGLFLFFDSVKCSVDKIRKLKILNWN